MNKDFLVILLQKDIHELRLLTEGFEKMTEFPEPILRLAKQKAENILKSLHSLTNNTLFELGEIDYQSFTDEKEKEKLEKAFEKSIFTEKNNFDAPSDSDLELPHPEHVDTDLQERQHNLTDSEKNEIYNETEHQLDNAAGRIDDEAKSAEAGISISLDEEFQEEIEVEEIGENEQVLAYDESDISSVTGSREPEKSATEPKKDIVNDRLNHNSITLNESLQKQETCLLSDSLANQKIDDIREAMNIGDRFRFQRELFGNNGEVMNKSITYLNQLARYEEAFSYLKSKFGWSEDNPHAEEFLQIIKRRYL